LAIQFSNAQQTNTHMEQNHNNPLLCDPEKGICEIPNTTDTQAVVHNTQPNKPIQIIYFTDPICSSCWGIEPQLRKLKLEYGAVIDIKYHMGGLLPDWSYNSGGISKPSDVASHWDEVSKYYQMPIDGDVWLEDPLNSSYPPSIAFKAAQIQDEKKAVLFLRRIREMVFMEKKNITRWEHLREAALSVGLDTVKFKEDYTGPAELLFKADLEVAQQYGVRGFPTLFFLDSTGRQEKVYGFQPYETFKEAILKLLPEAPATAYTNTWQNLFTLFPTLTSREFSELSLLTLTEGEWQLQQLNNQGLIKKTSCKNGSLWSVD
jgi:predicted DsbA family dithiol-disulfide isomerase